MPEVQGLEDILILLTLALGNAFVFSRLRQSPIIGYLVTGILVGPFGFHLIENIHEVEQLAEIGVILLLFTIGLEFSFSRILRLKALMGKCGGTQVGLSVVLLALGATLLNLPWTTAWTLGMAMALSSTAIVLKSLMERGEVDSAHGRIALAILLFQDLCVIFFLVALPLMKGNIEGLSLWGMAKSLGLMAGLFVFSRYLLRSLFRHVMRTGVPELFRLTTLVLVFGTAWVTAEAGLSLALGAFLAGLFLAESDYSHQILSDIIPFRDTFLAIFFISMGMLINARMLADEAPLVLGLFLLVALLKTGAGTAAALWSRYPFRTALLTGVLLFQVGEFSFVLLKQALAMELVSEEAYQITLSIIALSMMVTPMIIPRAPALANWLSGLLGQKQPEWPQEDQERTANLEGHVIIAGYGLSGRNVGRVLRQMRIPYIHIEMNGEAVRQARKKGELIIYGDATSPTVLEGVGIERARALVLAINDPPALARAIQGARKLNENLYILARTRFVLELDHLTELGANEVIPDELEASLQLSANLLQQFSIPKGRILKLLSALREEHYGRLRQEGPPATLSGYLSVLEGGEIEMQAIPDASPCLGKTLAQMEFRTKTGATVVGLIRQERIIYSPIANTPLEKGDTLMLLGGADEIHLAREMIHGRLS